MDDGSVLGFSTETGTVIMTLAGVSFVGSGHKSETSDWQHGADQGELRRQRR
jgi:hypothetical protein